MNPQKLYNMNDAVKLLTQAIQLICDDEAKKKGEIRKDTELRERILLLDNMIKKMSNDHETEITRRNMSLSSAYAIISDMVASVKPDYPSKKIVKRWLSDYKNEYER